MENRQYGHANKRRAVWRIPVIVFFASFAVLGGLFAMLYHFHNTLRHQELRYLASTTANKITKVITDRIWKTSTLAALVHQGDGDIQDFEKIAALLVNETCILNVSLAPGGVVSRVYPLPGNEDAIGLDYLGSGGKEEARSAMETKRLTLAGPFTLIQGGQALTGRLPVFLPHADGEAFWGFVGIALKYPDVLDLAALDELYQRDFVGQVWRINPGDGQRQIIWQSDTAPLKNPETREVKLFNVTWQVSVARHADWLGAFAPAGYLLAIALFCLVLSVLVFHYQELRSVVAKLEHMEVTDALTGLPNRRAIMNKLSEAITLANATKGYFTLVYIDLNAFKAVNDAFGHDVGDRVLTETARTLLECVGNKGSVGRVGGDKFIIVLPDYRQDGNLSTLIDHITSRLRRTIHSEAGGRSREVRISASAGEAFFPGDGTDVDTLLHCADVKMVEAKKELESKSPSYSRRIHRQPT